MVEDPPIAVSTMDVDAYLQRIGFEGRIAPNLQTLEQLHLAHLLTVPFENLDIHLGRKIRVSREAAFKKIVGEQRGGFCYELNGLFSELLGELGFDVTLLSARVYDGDELGPEFDHMLIQVNLDRAYIVDVGFGDSFVTPFPMESTELQCQRGQRFQLCDAFDGKLLRRTTDKDWENLYTFGLKPRVLSDYSDTCHYQQTSPLSPFTQKSVCSRLSEDGRITVSNNTLMISRGTDKQESQIANEDDYRVVMQKHFGIVFPEDAPIDRLMTPTPVGINA